MKHTRLTLLILFMLLVALLLAALPGFSEANVFDIPGRHPRHLQLLALMDAAHAKQDYAAMEASSREGLRLGASDALWTYNLACALALRGKPEESLVALDQAISAGFLDAEHALQDPDLAALRGTPGLQARIARMAELRASPEALTNRVVALRPDAANTVMQTSSNTLWSFSMGLFQSFVALSPPAAPGDAYRGPEAAAISGWLREGTAAGASGVLYANRDNNTQPLDIARFPGLLRLGYAQEMIDRRLNIGLPNTLFASDDGQRLIPVIGHSSMGYLNSPYWRSQPRAVCGDPRQATLHSVFLLGGQLFFYPTYDDYNALTGDLFPANTPYFIAVAGQLNAERPFVEAAAAALSALRPDTRAALARNSALMPTLQMLFRASQRTVSKREDYLTGLAHPPAFQAENLDVARLVRMAHALTTNDIPPVVILNVQRETQLLPDRDFFDILRSEQLFDSPLAVARIFRGAARTRTLEVQTICPRADAKLHWVVLQGDPAKVTFSPCATNSNLMRLTIAYHAPFSAPAGNGKSVKTARVDIGVIAETASGYSTPSFISFCFLGNEQRVYAADGRILSIDYSRPQTAYTDPLMSFTRNWKDSYQYDAQKRLTGWTRTRGLRAERFTAYGHLIVSTDAAGRATRAHVVRYLPRRIKLDDTNEGLPDLAQVDDNIEVAYRYASDSDTLGTPDLSTLKQDFQPPSTEVLEEPPADISL
jgi:YD repeat-containing protein